MNECYVITLLCTCETDPEVGTYSDTLVVAMDIDSANKYVAAIDMEEVFLSNFAWPPEKVEALKRGTRMTESGKRVKMLRLRTENKYIAKCDEWYIRAFPERKEII